MLIPLTDFIIFSRFNTDEDAQIAYLFQEAEAQEVHEGGDITGKRR